MPIVTALLFVSIAAVFGLENEDACQAYGFIPARPSFDSALTSMWLHDPSGLSHVAGNLVCLVVFGVVVERALGSVAFAGLYVAAGLAGTAFHVLVAPSSTVPLVGASGALFGLLAVAGVLRPRMLGFVVAYVGFEVWRAFTGDDGGSSFGCHLGGFFAGFLVVLFLRAIRSEVLEAA